MTNDALVEAIADYIRENGGLTAGYGWYTGITTDPQGRLFKDHRVNKRDGAWIYGEAETDSAAWEVERRLLESGCQSGSRERNSDARFVLYADENEPCFDG